MPSPVDKLTNPDRELVITRLIDAPRAKIFKAWSDPELMKRWWSPRPWTTPVCEIDLQPGGLLKTVMRGPANEEHSVSGVILAIEPDRRIVWTDAYLSPWVPSEKPFMTADISLDEQGGKTLYTARVLHWSPADREEHEKMGFHAGWTQCVEQLAEVVATL